MAFPPMVQTTAGGRYPNVRAFPIYGGGTSFIWGDLVFYDTTNFGLDRCPTNPTSILGIALCNSTTNAAIYPNSRIPVAVLAPEDVVVMDITNNAVAYLPNDQIMYKTYGITRDAQGRWAVDVNKSAANQVLTVVDHSPKRTSPTGAQLNQGQAFTYVKFLASVLQGDSIVS